MRSTSRPQACDHLGRIGAMFAAVLLACAIGIWYSWVCDNAILREKALAITADLTSASARITGSIIGSIITKVLLRTITSF